MTKVIAILLLLLALDACKFKLSTKDQHVVQAPDQLRDVVSLSAQEQAIGQTLCEALDKKRALFRTMHDGQTFDFSLSRYTCGTKNSEKTVTATLHATVGAPMTYDGPTDGPLYFSDVLTNTDGITHFLCDKIAAGQAVQNTIVVSDVEKIQIRLSGTVLAGVILEISDFITNSSGVQVFKEMQSIKFHVKLPEVSDYTGLEIERAVYKKCVTDGKLTTGNLQKSLQLLP